MASRCRYVKSPPVYGEALRAQGTAESLRLAAQKYEEALPLWRAINAHDEEANRVSEYLKIVLGSVVFTTLGVVLLYTDAPPIIGWLNICFGLVGVVAAIKYLRYYIQYCGHFFG